MRARNGAPSPHPAAAAVPADAESPRAPQSSGAVEAPEQRRILTVLVLSQILSGAGLAAGITVGALLAEEMLGSTGMAGVPSALFTAGAALGAVGIGQICRRHGRRPGLALGYAVGSLGSLGVVVAATVGSVLLLFLALLVYGAGTATNLMARYAGADRASPERRGRAVSTVLFATTLGAVVGPNLVTVTGEFAHVWGLPRLAGPFLLAVVAFGAAAVVLACFLRPDPLAPVRPSSDAAPSPTATVPATDPDGGTAVTGAPKVSGTLAATRAQRRGVVTGTTVMVIGQLVMIAIMTMTPVHMRAHGHDTQAAGLVIALHVGAMFLPSPLTGLLVDRIGRLWMAAASGLTLLIAGVVAALAPAHSLPALATALVLLGLGWNFGLISGTAIVTDALPPDRRASAQGLVDVGLAIAGAAGGISSGPVIALGGYPTLAWTGGILALATVPVLALAARAAGPVSRAAEPAGQP